MAGYGYNTHGYSTYTTPPPSDEWTKSSYSSSDHVHRPSIIDDQGRRRPILSYETNPNTVPYYTTKAETVVQHQNLSPFSPEYNNQQTVHWTNEDYEGGKYRKPLGPVNGGRPPMVDEYLTRVQNEASRARVGPWTNGASWRQDSNPGGYSELSNKEYLKSTGGAYRNDTSIDEYYCKQGSGMEPQVFTTTHSTWSTPPNTSLSKPTNNITEAVEMIVKEAMKSAYGGTTGRPTNNITEAVGIIMKEAMKPTYGGTTGATGRPTNNITEAVGIIVKEAMKPSYGGTTGRPTNSITEAVGIIVKEAMKPAQGGTTSSNDPAKRYGNFNFIVRKVLT